VGPEAGRSFVDLHSHTRASFDSLSAPESVVRAAAANGLTHLAITDHDRIEGALEARAAAAKIAPELSVIVGEEVRTADGDLIALFLDEALEPGRPAADTIADARRQGALIGIPHPFDRYRGSLLRDERMAGLAPLVDWVETHNARIMVGPGNDQAAAFAREHRLPGVAVSDAHTLLEVGVAYTVLDGDPSTAAGLLRALPTAELVRGRATFFVRGVTPLAKVVQRLRGNRRVPPASSAR
jgi:predicted metal-dependent phosphoesterase TrpH